MHILYEEAAFVVVVKEPGQLSEAAEGNPASLITLLQAHFLQKGENATPYPIHRLDQRVGGVMVYAKTRPAAAALSAAVQQNRLTKEYLATIHGTPAPVTGTWEDLLWKDSRKNKTYVVSRQRKGVKPARLSYQVLQTEGDRSLVQVHLYTGRSHQIRVQFASRKHPLLGDGKYGAKDNLPLALFSFRLGFPHPTTGRPQEFCHLPTALGGFPLEQVPLPLK